LIICGVSSAQETTQPSTGAAAGATSAEATDSTTPAPDAAGQQTYQEILEKGDAALKAGDYEAALAAFAPLVTAAERAAAFQVVPVAAYGLGRALAGLKEYPTALENLKKAVDEGSDPALVTAARLARGQVYLDINNPELALPDFQEAYNANRGNMEAALGYGKALAMLGRADESIAPLTRVITADPKNAEAHRYRATGYASTSKIKEAIDDLQQSLSLNPDDYETYFTLGIVYLREEDYQKAAEEIAKAIQRYKPKSGQEDVPYVQGYLTLASTYNELGKTAKDEATKKAANQSAIKVCDDLLKQLSPKNTVLAAYRAAALYQRGVGERMLGNYGEAIRSFSEAIEVNPELGDAYFRRGICFHMLNEDRMAISDFEQASFMSSEDPRASLWAGFTYAKLGEYHKALRAYGDAIAVSDRYGPAYLNRGLTYMALGENEKAIADFNQAIRLDPAKADNYIKRARAFEQMGDSKKALDSYATAIAFDTKNAEAYRRMAESLQAQGRSELAAEYRKKAEELAPAKKSK
jgi:tetratricopeptide (TPR) repeat protein